VLGLLVGPKEGAETPGVAQAEQAQEVAREEPPAEAAAQPVPVAAQPVDVPTIDDKTVNDFIRKFSDDYNMQFWYLVMGYEDVRKDRYIEGFYNFRKDYWHPDYDKKRAYYHALLEKNRAYLFKTGLDQLISGFVGIALAEVHLNSYLLHGDREKIDIVRREHKDVMDRLTKLNRERKLKLQFKEVVVKY
jgi:hypothetical protein